MNFCVRVDHVDHDIIKDDFSRVVNAVWDCLDVLFRSREVSNGIFLREFLTDEILSCLARQPNGNLKD